jgi:hypothetical protein
VENAPSKCLYGHSWMWASVKACKDQDSAMTNPQEELTAYLMALLEEQVDDVIVWWGVSVVQLGLRCTDSFSLIASLHSIPHPCLHSMRLLSCPGVFCTIRTSLLKWGPHCYLPAELSQAIYIQGLADPERCIPKWAHQSIGGW